MTLSCCRVRKCLAVVALIGTQAGAQVATDEAARSPWGANDEIGTLNMMTEESMRTILGRSAAGSIYDLGVELFVGMPDCCSTIFGDPKYQKWMIHTPARESESELVSHSSDVITMSTHTGTHIDALSHFGLRGEIWNRVKAGDALGDRGWTRSGAEKYPPIVARGVLIDVARSKNIRHLPASYTITPEDLQYALKEQGTTLRSGDVVLIRTGLMNLWPALSDYHLEVQAGIGLEAAQWLVEEKKAMLLGADNLGLESFPSESTANFAPVHSYLLAEKGVSFMEVMWLEDLAADRVYEFLFIAAPLKLRGATGSPVRPLAIPLHR